MSERIEPEQGAAADGPGAGSEPLVQAPAAPAAGPLPEAAVTPPDVEFEEVREPYSRQRFLREAAVALAILAVGLPLVLLLSPKASDSASEDVLVGPSALASASTAPSPSPGVTNRDARPVHLVAADVPLAVAQQVVQAATSVAASTGTATLQAGKGFTSVQPSLGTVAAQGLPGRELALVAVQAGAADVDAPPRAVQTGAALVADRLRAAVAGNTSIALVGPIPDGEPTPALLRVRDEVRAAARAKGVHFVDPVALGLQLRQPDLAARLGAAAAVYIKPAGA